MILVDLRFTVLVPNARYDCKCSTYSTYRCELRRVVKYMPHPLVTTIQLHYFELLLLHEHGIFPWDALAVQTDRNHS